MESDIEKYVHYVTVMTEGLYYCLVITAVSFVCSVLFGTLFAVLRHYGNRLSRLLIGGYVEVFRAMPPLTIFFILYFGLAHAGLHFSPLSAAITGLSMIGAAYCCEIIRSGLVALKKGDREAALAAGLTPNQALRFIILPQALRTSLPSLGTYLIGLIKDTSIASAIAAPEILFRARNLASESFETTAIYLVVALVYLVITIPIAVGVGYLEKKAGR